MNVSFGSSRIAKICNISQVAVRKLGTFSANKLQQRLNEFDGVQNLEELRTYFPQCNVHPLTGNRAGQFAVNLHGGNRLIFVPDQDLPQQSNDAVDFSHITAITITEIGDYHD